MDLAIMSVTLTIADNDMVRVMLGLLVLLVVRVCNIMDE